MRCIVCDNSEWENADHLRESKKGMAMCKSCGFVSYPDKYQTEEEIKRHYRTDYRPAPNVQNFYTSERKIYYHEHFLRPLIEEWKKAKFKPVIGEIGSAFGLFLAWISKQLPSEIYGTELTTSFRRVAFHEYGIKLTEDFDFSKKYDLIVNYHVLEHQLDADQMLKKYADCLSDNGLIYLGTPVWFREATNFGASGFDLSYYWATDHINCWSEEHLESIFKKCGLKIIMKNTVVYGNTYLLSRNQGAEIPEFKHDPAKYKDAAERIKKCWEFIQSNDSALAIESWPNCPCAWINHYEINRNKFHVNRQDLELFMEKAVKSCPNTSDTLMLVGDIHRRYEQWEKAYECFKRAHDAKPNNPTVLLAMSDAIRQKALRSKDGKEKAELLTQASSICEQIRKTSMECSGTATTWIYHDQALIPMEGE